LFIKIINGHCKQKKRSEIMSKIRSKNTKPEMMVRNLIFSSFSTIVSPSITFR